MKQNTKKFVALAVIALFVAFFVLALSPVQNASATPEAKQSPQECLACHEKAGNLWESSHHKTSNVSCIVCHKLAQSDGKHPDNAKYTVESEETTCLVCHADVAGTNVAGQMQISKHGEVGLTCVSCHEQHSQGLKLAEGSRIICENCHKAEMRSVVESTHFKAGLSCVNCHMGKDKNHTLVVSAQTCGDCHDNLHEAKRIVDAGLEVRMMDTPAAMTTVETEIAADESHVEKPASGGITMPAWTLVFSGMLIGGVLTWALAGKDPGKPSDEQE